MKTVFDSMHINYAEYSYFTDLDGVDQVAFLFDIYETTQARHSGGLDLSRLFDMVKETLQEPESKFQTTTNPEEEFEKVDVMIDDDTIMIESNSLVAVRHITYKFFEGGYILSRDREMEKMFRRDKVTRYLRIFRIIDQVTTICVN